MQNWIVNSADKANAFVLARAGYDVWMGNNRGCRQSLGHEKYSTSEREYWEFY
jgi:hypothetical protein